MLHEVHEARRLLRAEGLPGMATKAARYFRRLLVHYPCCRLRMPALAARLDLDPAIAFVFTGAGKLLLPAQIRSEVERFFHQVAPLAPRVVLEIGTAAGGMLFLFTRIAAPDATLISIDLRGAPYGGGYPGWRVPLYRRFGRSGQQVHLVDGNSHDPATLDRVKALLGGRPVDLLFIDADHSYQGVKTDFESYSPLVGQDGVIAFHDIAEADPGVGLEVSRFWKETSSGFDHAEVVADPDQRGFGIGILRRPGARPPLPGFTPAAAATSR